MEEERVVHQGGVKEHLEMNLNSVKWIVWNPNGNVTNLKTLMGKTNVLIIVNAMDKEHVVHQGGVKEELEYELINEELRIITSIYLSL